MRLATDQHTLDIITRALNSIDDGHRSDAGEVAFVAKDLDYVYAQTYDVEYPELKGLQLVPVDTSVDPGAETFSYGQWDMIGKAKWISDYAKDFPMVDALLKRFVYVIAGIGVGYQYSIQDLRKAAMRRISAGKSLDVARAEAAALAHAQFVDRVLCYGDTARGLDGFINHPDIPVASIPNGSWNTLTASDADRDKIAQDLTFLSIAPEIATVGLYVADTLLLPLSMKQKLMNPTSTYIKQPLILNWLQNNENIKSIVWWNRLDAAYSEGTYSSNEAWAMAYKKDKKILWFCMPLMFTQHPPQQEGLAFKVPCESRVGGMAVPRPLACAKANTHS